MNPMAKYFLLIIIPILLIFVLFVCFDDKIMLKNNFLYKNSPISMKLSNISNKSGAVSMKLPNGVCATKLQNFTIYTNFCPDEVKDIPLNISYSNGTEIRKLFNRAIVFFDPNGVGNYTVALLNLLYALPKQRTWAICVYYDQGCKLYLYNETQDAYIVYPTKQHDSYIIYYELPKNSSFSIFLNLGNSTKIIQRDYNSVLIEGTNSTIRKAVDRFIFWWYGIL